MLRDSTCVRTVARVSALLRVCPHCCACVRTVACVSALLRVCPHCCACVRTVARVSALLRVCPHCCACVRTVARLSPLLLVCPHCCACVRTVARVSALLRCKFDSNSTQNTSPALRVLCLVVSVTQSFETTSVHLKSKHKQTKELDFLKVSTTLEIFNVFLERYS